VGVLPFPLACSLASKPTRKTAAGLDTVHRSVYARRHALLRQWPPPPPPPLPSSQTLGSTRPAATQIPEPSSPRRSELPPLDFLGEKARFFGLLFREGVRWSRGLGTSSGSAARSEAAPSGRSTSVRAAPRARWGIFARAMFSLMIFFCVVSCECRYQYPDERGDRD
jgi:hypothetical protein